MPVVTARREIKEFAELTGRSEAQVQEAIQSAIANRDNPEYFRGIASQDSLYATSLYLIAQRSRDGNISSEEMQSIVNWLKKAKENINSLRNVPANSHEERRFALRLLLHSLIPTRTQETRMPRNSEGVDPWTLRSGSSIVDPWQEIRRRSRTREQQVREVPRTERTQSRQEANEGMHESNEVVNPWLEAGIEILQGRYRERFTNERMNKIYEQMGRTRNMQALRRLARQARAYAQTDREKQFATELRELIRRAGRTQGRSSEMVDPWSQ